MNVTAMTSDGPGVLGGQQAVLRRTRGPYGTVVP
jgi:hypothetical protein